MEMFHALAKIDTFHALVIFLVCFGVSMATIIIYCCVILASNADDRHDAAFEKRFSKGESDNA